VGMGQMETSPSNSDGPNRGCVASGEHVILF
jgi:hypothetical protein